MLFRSVIRETIGKDLPKGFQSAEFVLEHGFLDFIVDRKEMKEKIEFVVGNACLGQLSINSYQLSDFANSKNMVNNQKLASV